MPQQTRITGATFRTRCLACDRWTRDDGYCRTPGCQNRVPDSIVAPAREAALAEMRALLHHDRTDRSHD